MCVWQYICYFQCAEVGQTTSRDHSPSSNVVGVPVGVDEDLAHAHVLLSALVVVDVVVSENNAPSPGPVDRKIKKINKKKVFLTLSGSWLSLIIWHLLKINILHGKRQLKMQPVKVKSMVSLLCALKCINICHPSILWRMRLQPVHAVSSRHDPSSSDQGSSTGVVEAAARFILKGDLMKQWQREITPTANGGASTFLLLQNVVLFYLAAFI